MTIEYLPIKLSVQHQPHILNNLVINNSPYEIVPNEGFKRRINNKINNFYRPIIINIEKF